MILKNNKYILVGILSFSICSLLIAYYIEYVLGHKPCNLCLIERVPYFISFILTAFILVLNRLGKIISIIILLSFIFGAIVSFYHFGIEQGFFSESLVCNLGNGEALDKEQLLKQLEQSTVTSCKDVTFRFLGFSLATINMIISIILSGIMIKVIKNYD
ncbi:MAG: disulfide bond formation protein B [Pelagibacteraceae bacterium]